MSADEKTRRAVQELFAAAEQHAATGARLAPGARRPFGGSLFEDDPTPKRKGRTRPRGFAPYRPQPEALALIAATRAVLEEYREHLPLTLRQVYYRLVSRELVGKTESEYGRLCEILGRARRGRLLDMSAFRDDGFRQGEAPGWDDADQVVRAVAGTVAGYTRDRQDGQRRRLVLWCEAAGMVPQLERVAHEYSVPVFSSGGFDSITAKHAQARAIADDERPTFVLHVGDHDVSGVHLYGSLDEDVRAFVQHYAGTCTFARLAVTPEQVERYGLPQAPPKATDRRAFEGLTTQAEALDPRTLADIVREAIEAEQDAETRRAVIEREHAEREALRERFGLTG